MPDSRAALPSPGKSWKPLRCARIAGSDRPWSRGRPRPGRCSLQLDDELDRLLANWTRTLLVNLDDPATHENLSLLQPERATRVNAFVAEGKLPDVLEPEFVEALQEVLSGLVKVVVTAEDLKAALLAGGSPASPTEMKARFEGYLDGLAKGDDPAKVRVVLE